VLWIVLPRPAAAITDVGAIAALKMANAIEVVIVVDEDVVAAAPAASPAPSTAPHCSHEDADTE
jgi:hypothetical protein